MMSSTGHFEVNVAHGSKPNSLHRSSRHFVVFVFSRGTSYLASVVNDVFAAKRTVYLAYLFVHWRC